MCCICDIYRHCSIILSAVFNVYLIGHLYVVIGDVEMVDGKFYGLFAAKVT